MFFPQENKCKVLELIPHNLEGTWCELMALICLCMLTNVATRNTRMQPLKPILMFTQGAQTYVVEEEKEP